MSSCKHLVALIFVIAVLALTHTTSAQNSPDDYVEGHNAVRTAVGVGPVSWNDTVAAYTKNYIGQLVGVCALIPSNTTVYGELLFKGPAGKMWTAQDAIDAWASGKQYYDYVNNTCVKGKEDDCFIYKQIVWARTISIGCARAVCNTGAGAVIIICDYYPGGNLLGRPY